MTTSIDARFSPKRVSISLAAACAGSILAVLVFPYSWLALTSIFLVGALPFALVPIWLPRSRLGKFLVDAASVWQLRIFGISALFAYSVCANKWAGDTINRLFGVDAGHFGVSTTVLAVLFAPFGLVYRQEVVSWLWTGFIVVGMIISYALPLSLLMPGRARLGWKAWGYAVLYFFVGSLVLGMSANLTTKFDALAMQFVVWADFNDSHLCTDEWTREPNSVAFLGDQRVLVNFPGNPAGSRFSVESCNQSRKF
jgi:hypothetical protein